MLCVSRHVSSKRYPRNKTTMFQNNTLAIRYSLALTMDEQGILSATFLLATKCNDFDVICKNIWDTLFHTCTQD